MRPKHLVTLLFLAQQVQLKASGLEVQLGYNQTTITVPANGAVALSTPFSVGIIYRLLMAGQFRLHFKGEYTMGMDFITTLTGGGAGLGYLFLGREPMVFQQGADFISYTPNFALEVYGGFSMYAYNVKNIVPAPVQKTTGVRQIYQRGGVFMMPYGGVKLEYFFKRGPSIYSVFLDTVVGASLGDTATALTFFSIRPSLGLSLYL